MKALLRRTCAAAYVLTLLAAAPAAQKAAVPAAAPIAADGSTALHLAVDREDAQAVVRLLRTGADVNARTRLGVTSLWLAASYGNAAIIEHLLKAGADAKATNPENGETVLMMAARSGHADAVKVLLAHGADVNAVERLRSQTALMWAAAQKHPEAVKVLLEAGAKVTVASSTGLTPMHFAIRSGDIKSTELLIAAGADIRTPYEDGTTSLMLAIINAHYELAATLLDHGVDPNAPDSNGTALHALAFMRAARGQHNIPVVERLPTGNLDTIGLATRLLARGANVNARLDWKDGGVGTHAGSAVNGGRVGSPRNMAVTTFNHLTFAGATPFWLAAFYGDPDFMRFLAANGADPKLSTRQNVNPLLAAAGVGYSFGGHSNEPAQVFEAVKVAYELGNDVHAVVDFGEHQHGDWRRNGANALHGAAMRGHHELITWLVEKGVALDRITEGGWHPVHCAEGVWVVSIVQIHQGAAKLLRQLVAERGLPQPRVRTGEEIQTDGLNRPKGWQPAPAVRAAAQAPGRTVWDGVYTEAQAARGQTAYTRACSYCHRDDLSGGGADQGAPALVGVPFFVRWENHTLREFFETIALTMPLDKPGALTPQESLDIVSFILKTNKMPPGSAELPLDPVGLGNVRITEKAEIRR